MLHKIILLRFFIVIFFWLSAVEATFLADHGFMSRGFQNYRPNLRQDLVLHFGSNNKSYEGMTLSIQKPRVNITIEKSHNITNSNQPVNITKSFDIDENGRFQGVTIQVDKPGENITIDRSFNRSRNFNGTGWNFSGNPNQELRNISENEVSSKEDASTGLGKFFLPSIFENLGKEEMKVSKEDASTGLGKFFLPSIFDDFGKEGIKSVETGDNNSAEGEYQSFPDFQNLGEYLNINSDESQNENTTVLIHPHIENTDEEKNKTEVTQTKVKALRFCDQLTAEENDANQLCLVRKVPIQDTSMGDSMAKTMKEVKVVDSTEQKEEVEDSIEKFFRHSYPEITGNYRNLEEKHQEFSEQELNNEESDARSNEIH